MNILGTCEEQAARLARAAIDSVQISIYSHKAEVHDAITKLPGSLKRSVEAAKLLRAHGVRVFFANVLMKQNAADCQGGRWRKKRTRFSGWTRR